MDTRKAASEYRLSQWAQVVQERRNSGQSVKDFCRTAGISRNAYFYWQKRLREAACTKLVKTEEPKSVMPGGWIRLASAPAQLPAGVLDIEIGGCHVTVTTETDHGLLAKVCQTLRSL